MSVRFISTRPGRIMLAAGLLVAGFLLGHYLPPWFNDYRQQEADNRSRHYRHTLQLQLDADVLMPADQVVFLGDSLTQALPVQALTPIGINYGIGTDSIAGVIERIPQYASLSRARVIVLAIGINDLRHSTGTDALNGYRQMLDALPVGPDVLCLGLLPVDTRQVTHQGRLTPASIQQFNAQLEPLCQGRNRHYLPPPQALRDADGQLDHRYHRGDGIHLNAAGYRLWIRHLAGQFEELGLPVVSPAKQVQ